MNTKFKHRILSGALFAAALFMGTSCDDSEGLKVTPEVPNADKTMYEVLLADTELSDFVDVLNSCGEHCADSLFNKSRVYTLWAPVNGTFDKDSLIAEVEKGNRDIVFQSFVKAHIANHMRAANGTLDEDNRILLLNDKMAVFKGDNKNGYTFADQPVAVSNIRVWNGILHKLKSPSEYKYNIMEYLKIAQDVDSVSAFIYSYNTTEFSPAQSIMGPIVGGEQTYLDSVFVTNNKLLTQWNGVGLLESEDSTYIVYVPSNDAWKEFLEESDTYFNYNLESSNPLSVSVSDRDSLRHYYARFNALKFMTVSVNEQKYVDSPDSIMPIGTSDFNRIEFAKEQLEKNVVFTKELSNGTFKIVEKCPFSFQELFYDTIKVEAENETMRYKSENTTDYMRSASKNQINKDSIFEGVKISNYAYYEGVASSKGRAFYKLPNALSAKYHLAVITVPKNITNADVAEEDLKPTQYTFTVSLSGRDDDLFVSPAIVSLADRVDTLFVTDEDGERAVIDVPYCEYYNTQSHEDYNLILKIEAGGSVRRYDQSIRLDAIMLIPIEETEE